MKRITKYTLGLIITATLLMAAGKAVNEGNYFEITKNIEIFANIYRELNTYYVDELDPGKVMRTGIDAIMNSMDPYTNYVSEAQIEGFRFISEGKYNGIGVNFKKKGDFIVIIAPMQDSPADKAGLKSGDVILEVDGKTAVKRTEEELNEIMQGFAGTEVILKVKRPNGKEEIVKVTRGEVESKNVPHFELITPEIGYVALTTFTRGASSNIAAAYNDLKKINPAMKGMILDLRGNGGGLLDEAVNICNIFIPKGTEVVSTRGKVKDWDKTYRTTGNSFDEKIPLVILIDRGSASASEIVSGTLQDLDRAVIMGQLSYGKGLVQNHRETGYNSRIKLTTAKYYTPSGRCIQAISYKNGEPVHIPDSLRQVFKTKNGRKVMDGGGVKPDVEIEVSDNLNLLKALDANFMVFDFATKYTLNNPPITNIEGFKFTDFDQFQQYCKDQKFSFSIKSEDLLNQMVVEAKKEKIDNLLQNNVAALRAQIELEKSKTLLANKERILSWISSEIASRYFYEKGRIMVRLDNDAEIKSAVELLNNPARYQKILK